jgi:hypothetical protein
MGKEKLLRAGTLPLRVCASPQEAMSVASQVLGLDGVDGNNGGE